MDGKKIESGISTEFGVNQIYYCILLRFLLRSFTYYLTIDMSVVGMTNNGFNTLVNGRYNKGEDKYVNDYGDEHFGAYPSAIKFFAVLRKRCLDLDINPSHYVTFMSYSNTGIEKNAMLYIRGTSMQEIFICMMYDYICRIDGITNIEFKIPRFTVECIKFQLKPDLKEWWLPDTDFDQLLPSSDVLRKCVLERFMLYHKNVITIPYVKPHYASKYLPTILVCLRYNICEDAEDIIHQFLGNKMINRYRYVSCESKYLIDQNSSDFGEHYRVWNSVNKILWAD